MFRRLGKGVTWTLSIFVVLIVAARIAAPYVIERVVNDKLAHLDGYEQPTFHLTTELEKLRIA